MNTRRIGYAAGTILAVGALGITAAAGAAQAGTHAASGPADRTLTFTEHPVSDRTFNLGHATGFAVGSTELGANTLKQGAATIGHDGLSCVVNRLGAGTADELCTWIFVLADGQVSTQGLVRSTPSGPAPFELGITGGTGAYQAARGYATVVPANDPLITLHIQL
jgi:hypothetical protein